MREGEVSRMKKMFIWKWCSEQTAEWMNEWIMNDWMNEWIMNEMNEWIMNEMNEWMNELWTIERVN